MTRATDKPVATVPVVRKTDEHGNTTEERFFGERTRYLYDRELFTVEEGWAQYDTAQDAWYFGVWVHIRRRVIVTYAEGDEIRTHYATLANLAAALEDMAATYGPPTPFAIVIGHDGTVTYVFDERPTVDDPQGPTTR